MDITIQSNVYHTFIIGVMVISIQVETLIEQYKKEQGNLPCKLAIACARPLSEAEVNNEHVLKVIQIRERFQKNVTARAIGKVQ